MSQEIYKKTVISEDAQTGSNNYMGVGKGAGQSAMQLKPGRVTLMDLVKQATDWENEMAKAPNRLPYPLQDGVMERIGDLYINVMDIKQLVAQSAVHSIIKDNKTANETVKKVHKKLSIIGAAIKDIVSDLDNLGVGTSTNEDHA